MLLEIKQESFVEQLGEATVLSAPISCINVCVCVHFLVIDCPYPVLREFSQLYMACIM